MRATEITKECWVKLNDPIWKGHNVMIREIGKDTVSHDLGVTKLSELKPIPITPGILDKSNLIQNTRKEYIACGLLVWETPDKRVEVQKEANDEWNLHIDDERYMTLCACTVKYVHQLQMLLFVYNINMKIVL